MVKSAKMAKIMDKNTLMIAWSFVKRDFLDWASYRVDALLWFINLIIYALTWAYFGNVAQNTMKDALSIYGYATNFGAFLLTGMALDQYLNLSLTRGKAISPQNLERWLLSPISLTEFFICSSIYPFMFESISALSYVLLGIAFGVIDLYNINFIFLLLVFSLGMVTMFGFSLMAGAVQILIKRGEPFTWFMQYVSFLLSGIYYPPEVLPAWIQTASWLLPQTYFLKLGRLAFAGAQLMPHTCEMFLLLCLSLIALPIGISMFKWSIKTAKKRGIVGFE